MKYLFLFLTLIWSVAANAEPKQYSIRCTLELFQHANDGTYMSLGTHVQDLNLKIGTGASVETGYVEYNYQRHTFFADVQFTHKDGIVVTSGMKKKQNGKNEILGMGINTEKDINVANRVTKQLFKVISTEVYNIAIENDLSSTQKAYEKNLMIVGTPVAGRGLCKLIK